MVLTIEPAIASKDGIFHHEQNVLVTNERIELLSSAPIALGTIH